MSYRLVPIISYEEFQALQLKGKRDVLKMRSLKNAFAYPSIEAVRKALDSNVLTRALESRTLVDAAPGRFGLLPAACARCACLFTVSIYKHFYLVVNVNSLRETNVPFCKDRLHMFYLGEGLCVRGPFAVDFDCTKVLLTKAVTHLRNLMNSSTIFM